ncbi:MAG: MlaC/ttg2D family ABC transporter substrate-binding protein [Steroidobacteraceae bacterium]
MRLPTPRVSNLALIVCGLLAAGAVPLAARAANPRATTTPAAAGPGAAGAGSAITGATSAVRTADGPSQVVESVAQGFLHDLNTHRAEYQKNPALLRQAVNRDVLPYFDVQYAARLVLARYWRAATPAQRSEFVSAFEDSVFANYGSALLSFQANHFQVLPARTAPGATDAIVRTKIRRDDGSTVQVDFALHQTAQGWKAWDVVIEGISYIKSFREQFGAEIEQRGLDAVIQGLQHGERPPEIATPGAKHS